ARATEKLARIIAFCESSVCRRKYLLEYFGEHRDEVTCDACDRCMGSARPMLPAALRTYAPKPAPKKRTSRFDHRSEEVVSRRNTHRRNETDSADDLFEALRALRKKLAVDLGVPPFVIFADVALREMARDLPQDDESFLAITGVGAQKLKRFGPVFMKTIRDQRGLG
ncbi:MAG TPA: HRDC domain-containing protein, partial [Bacteroidota bacterium]|nr:HRDC domain-containing protein [Bacteroidota bacterium]